MKILKRKRLPLLFLGMIFAMLFGVTAAYTGCKSTPSNKQITVHGFPKQIA